MKSRRLVALTLLLSMSLLPAAAGELSASRAADAAYDAPTLEWQHGGCDGWCETGWYSSPAVADLDGDGTKEVIAGAYSFEVVYTDFTEILYANGRKKAMLMPIIGHASKAAFGWAVGESANTALALQAWEQAKQTFKELNVSCVGMIMHHDRDPVYTGYGWTSQLLLKDELRLSYALGGAKDNPEMESFNGHFKGEALSLFLEAQSLDELIAVVDDRMHYYSTVRRHSSVGYVAPLTYIARTRADLKTRR